MNAEDARKAANRGYWWTVAFGLFVAGGLLIVFSDQWLLMIAMTLGGIAATVAGYRGTERGSSGRGGDVGF